jgi:hypothetical protein
MPTYVTRLVVGYSTPRPSKSTRERFFVLSTSVEWSDRPSCTALLPALHYAMLGFSRHVTGSLSRAGHDLQAKSDARFVENAWRALREAGPNT